MLDRGAEMGTGWRVLRCSGAPSETDMAFSGLNQLLTPRAAVLDRLEASTAETLAVALGLVPGRRPQEASVAEAVASLLSVGQAAGRHLLVVDDLQWLDTESIETMRLTFERMTASRLKVIATCRRGVPLAWDTTVHELQPLTEPQAHDLVSARHRELGSAARHRIVAESGGNPLVLLELAHIAAGRHGHSQTRGYGEMAVTPRLNALYADDIAELTAPGRTTLLLAALTRHPKIATVQAAAPTCDVPAELSALEARQLVKVDEHERVVFASQFVRHAILSASTAEERYTAHRALADAMADRPDHRAWHLGEATSEPDDAVAALLEHKAQEWRGSGDIAASVSALYRSADLSVDATQRHHRRALAQYLDARLTGEPARGPLPMGPAVRIAPGSSVALQSAIVSAFTAFDEDGNIDFAHRVLVNALDDCLDRGDRDGPVILEALEILLTVCKYAANERMWAAFYDVISGLDGVEDSLFLLRMRLVADPARTAVDAVGQLDETIGHLQVQKDPTLVTLVAAASHYVDRVRVLRPDLLLISRSARQGGSLSLAVSALMPVCIDDVRTGRWEDADRLIAECLDLCQETGFLMQSWPVRLAAAWLAGGRGDDAAARRIGTEVLRWASATGAGGAVRFAHQVLASSALTQGNWEDAYIHAAAVSAPGVLEPNVGHALWAAFDMVEAAVRAGHVAEAAAHTTALRDARLELLSPRLALIVAGCSAMVASDADFADLFDRALASPGASDWPVEQARLNLVCGERLRRCRRISKARVHLRLAVDGFAALGAPTWRARAQAELDATGHRDGDARSPMGALTPQEMQVARLAATGLTNKAIAERLSLSHRTVGAHLEQVLPKLGINSRARLGEVISGLLDAARDGVS